MVLYGDGVFFFFFPFQENEKSPSQNRKAKDATSDNGKGETFFLPGYGFYPELMPSLEIK